MDDWKSDPRPLTAKTLEEGFRRMMEELRNPRPMESHVVPWTYRCKCGWSQLRLISDPYNKATCEDCGLLIEGPCKEDV